MEGVADNHLSHKVQNNQRKLSDHNTIVTTLVNKTELSILFIKVFVVHLWAFKQKTNKFAEQKPLN